VDVSIPLIEQFDKALPAHGSVTTRVHLSSASATARRTVIVEADMIRRQSGFRRAVRWLVVQ
jgi:hypothetical protein